LQTQRNAFIQLLLILGILCALAGLFYANYLFSRQLPGGNNFLNRWVGARYWLVEGIQPYDDRVSLEAQRMIYGRPSDITASEDSGDFLYPLPVMIFLAPFGFFPYPIARALWMTVSQLALPLLAIIAVRITDWRPNRWWYAALLVFSLLWYPALRSVFIGQFTIIEAVLIAGGILAVKHQNDQLAGVLFALSISKPQMPFLILPYVVIWGLWQRRWQLVLWTLGAMVLLVGGFMLLLPEWPILWLRQIFSYPIYTDAGSPVEIIAQWLPGIQRPLELALSGVFALYLLWEWFISLNKPVSWFLWTAMMTLVITNLIAFRTATANYVVLLPALVLGLSEIQDRWKKAGLVVVGVTFLAILAGGWALFLLTVEGNTESQLMYLPLPFSTFFLLLWTRWWTVKTTRLPVLSQ
jgi:hypothetical protein